MKYTTAKKKSQVLLLSCTLALLWLAFPATRSFSQNTSERPAFYPVAGYSVVFLYDPLTKSTLELDSQTIFLT